MYYVYLNEFGCPLNGEFFTDSISSLESLTLQLKEEKERNEKLTARLTGKGLYSVFNMSMYNITAMEEGLVNQESSTEGNQTLQYK